jgi:membrane protease YdiL (CAAX protease family)
VAGLPQTSLGIPVFLFGALCLSILATWIYLRTGGSVPSVMLFHYMVNISPDVFGARQLPFTLAVAIATALVLAFDRRLGWFRRDGTPGYQETGATLPLSVGR